MKEEGALTTMRPFKSVVNVEMWGGRACAPLATPATWQSNKDEGLVLLTCATQLLGRSFPGFLVVGRKV